MGFGSFPTVEKLRDLTEIAPKVDLTATRSPSALPASAPPIRVQPAGFAAATVIGTVTGLLPPIKELIGLIPNSGNKKKLCANMVRGVEQSERKVAAIVAAGGSSLAKIADTLRQIAAAGQSIEPSQLQMLALAIEMGIDADAKERASHAGSMIANCDALDAAMDHLVGDDDK